MLVFRFYLFDQYEWNLLYYKTATDHKLWPENYVLNTKAMQKKTERF